MQGNKCQEKECSVTEFLREGHPAWTWDGKVLGRTLYMSPEPHIRRWEGTGKRLPARGAAGVKF